MPFFEIEGNEFRVVEGTAKEEEGLWQGVRLRMRANNWISTENSPMRVLTCDIDLYGQAEEDFLRGMCHRGFPVIVSGDWIGPAAMEALVDIGNAQAWMGVNEEGEPVYKTVSLRIEQAS
jgi:hypothetical protein